MLKSGHNCIVSIRVAPRLPSKHFWQIKLEVCKRNFTQNAEMLVHKHFLVACAETGSAPSLTMSFTNTNLTNLSVPHEYRRVQNIDVAQSRMY